MKGALPAWVVVLAALSGCAKPPSHAEVVECILPPSLQQHDAFVEAFSGSHGAVPPGWTVCEGSWGTTHLDNLGHPAVMEGTGTTAEPSDCLPADPDGGFSCLLAPAGDFQNFSLTVTVQVLQPELEAGGAGVVINFQDHDNYQIVRYSVREQGWHLFTVYDGTREKQRDASTQPQTNPGSGVWIPLRVVSDGGRIQAYDGETLVIDYELPVGHSRSGAVGLFLRDDTTAQFDDFTVEPLA